MLYNQRSFRNIFILWFLQFSAEQVTSSKRKIIDYYNSKHYHEILGNVAYDDVYLMVSNK